MSKKTVSLTYDPGELFDLVRRSPDVTSSLGNELSGLLLGGGELPDTIDQLRLAVYSVTVNTSYQSRTGVCVRYICDDYGDPTDLNERRDRFLEEAIELYQSLGGTRTAAAQLVDYTFGRDPGAPKQEFGGTAMTLAALAEWAGEDLDVCAETELARCWQPEVVEKIRRKRSTRHGRGPLPGLSASRSDGPDSYSSGPPRFITVTGLDPNTDLDRIRELSQQYPIEWGVLFSKSRSGREPRYPSLEDIQTLLLTRAGQSIELSAHICGSMAEDIVSEGYVDDDVHEILVRGFGRIQLNGEFDNKGQIPGFLNTLRRNTTAVVQCCDPSRFPDIQLHPRINWLYDRSGGRGETPPRWPVPRPNSPLVGYAGGISPDNIGEVLGIIRSQHPDSTPYWLDMESGVRTDDRLDLDKVEAVCRVIWGDP